ncbi:mannose-6-phosphate isomerase, class I [Vibrio mimicus]
MSVVSTSSPKFLKLNNPIKNYAWGCADLLPDLFNVENKDAQPLAEVWMGAHPGGSSTLTFDENELTLADFIALDKPAILSSMTDKHFGELPYLFKILTAQKALSIQVHPDKSTAQQGFQREQEQGIDLGDFRRNYKDANHKPELVYALSEFQAMNGFRSFESIIENFKRVSIASLNPWLQAFELDVSPKGLESFFISLLQIDGEEKDTVLTELVKYAEQHQDKETFALICSLAEQYPSDIGLLCPLMLNVITLQPGDSMYLAARTPHAYVKGACLEIMANSDNVLRAGLTAKHIDINELVNGTTFEPRSLESLLLRPSVVDGSCYYSIPVDDFRFEVHLPDQSKTCQVNSAEILLAIEADATLTHSNGESITIAKGESTFIPAYSNKYKIKSKGRVARVFSG